VAVADPRRAEVTDWFDTSLGKRVWQEECLLMRVALEDVFGFDLLQVGHWGTDCALLEWARTQRVAVIDEQAAEGVGVHARLSALPLAADSVDAVLLPHTLERVDDPYAVLREAERVLRPEGALLICGFNPWSGWGLRRVLAARFDLPAIPPGIQRMISERRLKDWVSLLGIDVERTLGYLGPLAWGSRAGEAAYRPRSAMMGGAYLLKAYKRTRSLTVLRPRWKSPPRVLAHAAGPTSRVRS